MKKFALIGAAGFIAPRHFKAIKDTKNTLIAAVDKHDCVGVMDSSFPEADFFTEFERFDRHIDKLVRKGVGPDYVTVCSPNYLHDAHIRFALRSKADAICEKPVVINARNIEPLQEMERETGHKIHTILQLRHHPSIIALKEKVSTYPKDKKSDLDLTYITSRGRWYDVSWKGVVDKSGGIATNIGVHFFDMLSYVFGPVRNNVVHVLEPRRAGGYLELEHARVRWFLSINSRDLPELARTAGRTTYRQLTMNGESIEFSDGFTDLHTQSYRSILEGTGFGLAEALPSIEVVSTIRNSAPLGLSGDYHPFLKGGR